MNVGPTLARARLTAESRMLDTCTITAPAEGAGVYDPDTDTFAPGAELVVYEGRCEVRDESAAADRTPSVGEATAAVARATVKVPWATEGVRRGCEVLVTSSTHNPALAGVRLRVETVQRNSHSSCLRLSCEETTR